MSWLLLGVSIGMQLINNGLQKSFGGDEKHTTADYLAFNLLMALASMVTLLVSSGGLAAPSLFTVLFGAAFGLVTLLTLVSNLAALATGPLSYTVWIGCCAMVIPTLGGVLFWHEPVRIMQLVGVVLLLAALYLGVGTRGSGGVTTKWLLFCALLFVSSGAVGLMQKVHQTSAYRQESAWFLLIAFLTAAICLGLALIVLRRRGQRTTVSIRSRFLPVALGCGVCLGLVHKINLYLSGVMPSIVFFPLVNGGTILLSALVARLFFKERLTAMRLVSLLLGTAAIALIGNVMQLFF